jgi:thymidylate synthase ThyX
MAAGIHIVREPKVYLVGRQQVDEGVLQEFLEDHEVDGWTTDTDVGAEKLCEVAGRLCYLSYARPRPGGNKAYLGHILGVGHGSVAEHAAWNFIIAGVSRSFSHELVRHRAGFAYCLAGDVEVYSGSKINGVYDGVRKKWTMRQLYQWSQDHRRAGRIKLVTVRCFDGNQFVPAKVLSVAASGVKPILKVTLQDGKTIRCSADHLFMTPDGWSPLREMSVGTPMATNGLPAVGLDKAWLRAKYHDEGLLLGEIAAQAGCSPHTVRKWLRTYGLAKCMGQGMTGRTPWNRGKRYKAGWHHAEETKRLLSEQKRGAKNPQWQGDDASPQAGRLRAQLMYPAKVCESCGLNQGHRHHVDRNTLNNSPDNIRFLCPSCHTTLHIVEDGHPNVLRVKWVQIASVEPDGEEMTYDLEIGHAAHNFVANGIVTHNSQLSQRYVDESVAEYIQPAVIAADPEASRVWEEAVMACHGAYLRLVERLTALVTEAGYRAYVEAKKAEGLPAYAGDRDWWLRNEADRTALRKEARQAARSVLPNATETKVFVTANARALRHTIEMRCSRFAEPEIRKVFMRVLVLMQQEAPALFGDYERVTLPDGTWEAVTRHRKV